MTEDKRRRKRKVKRKMRKGCLLSLLSFVLLLAGIVVMFFTPIFNVDNITVTGNKRIGRDVIVRLSGIENGENIFALSKNKAEKKISGLQYVESVRVIKKYPDKVIIEIKEGQVDAYLTSGDKSVGITSTGQTLCTVDKGSETANAPIVKGFTVKEREIGKKVKVEEEDKYELFTKLVAAMKKEGIWDNLTEFDIMARDDISFMYLDKLLVEFGDGAHYENKISNLVAIIKTLTESSGGEIPTGIINMMSENYTFRSVVPKKSE